MEFKYSDYTYSVPSAWYDGLYHDRSSSPASCRSFCILHEHKPDQVWLVVHGFRGYPGEMIRPAQDLYDAGFDVYCPRLPGHGTSGRDFTRSCADDWMGLVRNAIADLKKRYKVVNVVGHSMGGAIMAVVAAADPDVGKIVYLCPAMNDDFIPQRQYRSLRLLRHFVRQIPAPWQPDERFRLHYENAPCDDMYLGREYWSHFQPRQLLDGLCRITAMARKSLQENYHDALFICASGDVQFSVPSAEIYRKAYGEKANVVEIPDSTHCIQYDINPVAEETAISAIVDYARS